MRIYAIAYSLSFDLIKDIIYFLLLFSTAATGWLNFKRLSLPFQWLTICVAFILVAECFSIFFKYILGASNFIVYHFQLPVMILMYGMVFNKLFETFGNGGRRWLIVPIVISVASIGFSFFVQSVNEIPGYALSLMSLFLVGYSLMSFWYLLQLPSEEKLLKQPVFWLATGTLSYYSPTFIFWGLYPLLMGSDSSFWMHHLNFVVNIIIYASYLVAIVLDAKQSEENEFALD